MESVGTLVVTMVTACLQQGAGQG